MSEIEDKSAYLNKPMGIPSISHLVSGEGMVMCAGGEEDVQAHIDLGHDRYVAVKLASVEAAVKESLS